MAQSKKTKVIAGIGTIVVLAIGLITGVDNDKKSIPFYYSYMPISAFENNDYRCSNKQGAALAWLGNHTQEHLDNLCIKQWYTYSPQNYTNRYTDIHYTPFFWCHKVQEGSSQGRLYRDWFAEQYPDTSYSGTLLFYNEWNHINQCVATSNQMLSDFAWVKSHYPNAKLIVGNTHGYDGGFFFPKLTEIHDLIVGAGYNWCDDIYATSYHDYYWTGDPALFYGRLSTLLDSWGCTEQPIIVSEWGADNSTNIVNHLEFYTNTPRVEQHYYFAPCQDEWAGTPLNLYDVEIIPSEPYNKLVCEQTFTIRGQAFHDYIFDTQSISKQQIAYPYREE